VAASAATRHSRAVISAKLKTMLTALREAREKRGASALTQVQPSVTFIVFSKEVPLLGGRIILLRSLPCILPFLVYGPFKEVCYLCGISGRKISQILYKTVRY